MSSVLQGVISQQILPRMDRDARVAAFEILRSTNAVKNLIREGKTHQLQTVIQTHSNVGMVTMDTSLINLYRRHAISKDVLMSYAMDTKAVKKEIGYRL